MAILFDDTTDAATLQSLQGKVMEMTVTAQATIEKEHTADGAHKTITATGIGSRTSSPLAIRSGVVWTGGPQTYAPPAVISPPALTADTHNWNPGGLATAQVIEITATASVRLTGIAVSGTARSQRRDLRLVNRSTVNLTLPSSSPDSLPEHRFLFGGVDYLLTAGTHVDLYYIPAVLRWSGVPSAAGGGGGGGAPDPHAPTHADGGSDPLAVTALAGFPSDATMFLRGDKVFAPVIPAAHRLTHEPGGTDPMAVDAAAATGSLRTLGTGPLQAAPGNDARFTTPAAHHATHEPGGADALVNAAWTNLGNIFTQAQTVADGSQVRGNNGVFYLLGLGSAANQRSWRFVNYGDGVLNLEARSDDDATLQGNIQVTRGSVMQAMGGLGATPLNASNLTTGLVPPARLPPLAAHHASHEPGGSDQLVNAAWRDLDNNFVAQTLATQTAIVGPQSVLRLQDPTALSGTRNWRFVNNGTGSLLLDVLDDTLATATTILEVRNTDGVVNLPYGALRFNILPVNTDPRVLDAYVEAPWTPTLSATGGSSGMTYAVNAGTYLKIGQEALVQFDIQIATLGTISGDVTLNLPFRNGALQSIGSVAYFSLTNKLTGLVCIAFANGTSAGFYYDHPTAGSMTALTSAFLAAGSILRGTVVYRAFE